MRQCSAFRRQAIIWTNADLFSLGPLGTNFSQILIKIQNTASMKMHFKMSSAKWRNECRMSAQCWKLVKTSVCVICCPGGTYAYMNVFFLPPELQSLTRALSVNPKHGYWWFHCFRWKLNMIRLCSCELKEKNHWGDKLRLPGKTLSKLSKIYLEHY